MATDINQIMQNSQAAINSAVETITETRKTQDLLQKHIEITDLKIAKHNTNTDAHPDIRATLSDMPAMILDPVIKGPSAVKTGVENSWTISATSMFPDVTIEKFIIHDDQGEKSEISAVDNSCTFSKTWTSDTDTQVYFTVKAIGNLKYVSRTVKQDVFVVQKIAPNLSKMETTLPKVVSAGQSYTFTVSKIYDDDGDFKHFTLTCDDSKITLPSEANTAMRLDTEYTLSVAADHVGPGEVKFKLKAVDQLDQASEVDLTARLNSMPVLSSMTHTVPPFVLKGSTVKVKFENITDPDKDTLTLAIASDNPGITFSKSEGIAIDEEIDLTTGDVAEGTTFNLTITATDEYKGVATQVIQSRINTPPDVSGLTTTYSAPAFIPGGTGTVTISGAIDVSAGQAITYNIRDARGKVTWGKTTGIAAGEAVNMTFAQAIERGSYSYNIEAVNTLGASTIKTVTLKINTLPNIQALQHTIPTEVVPGRKITCKALGAMDVDSEQTLKYTITTNTENVVLENATDIDAEALFSFTPPTAEQLARGENITLIISVSDGFEKVTKEVTAKQNKLPDISGITVTLPDEGNITAGPPHAIKITIPACEDVKTYKLVHTDSKLGFSKATGVIPGEEVTVRAFGITANEDLTFNIIGVDDLGEESLPKTITLHAKPWTVTKKPTITSPGKGAEVNANSGFTISFTGYEPQIWTADSNYP